jgi:hypothetical protein
MSFFGGLDEDLNPVRSTDYEREVIKGAKGELHLCLNWLADNGVIDVGDIDVVMHLRDERNRVAHEIAALLVDPAFKVEIGLLDDAGRVLRRIGVFFGRIVADSDPEVGGEDVADEDIISGRALLFGHAMAATADALDRLRT